MSHPEIWITGIGLVTPVGVGREASWSAFRAGQSGIGPIRGWDCSDEAVHIAAQVPEEWEAEFGKAVRLPFARRYGRFTKLALHAGQEALEQAGLLPEQREGMDPTRAGVAMGVGGGATHYVSPLRDAHEAGDAEGFLRGIDHYFVIKTMFNAPAGMLAIQYDLQGPSTITSAACASGAASVATGMDWIRSGRADWVLVGGCDSTVDRETIRAYHRVGALTAANERASAASRPFDKDRGGFVMAEGSAAMVLESAEHARRRGAQPLASVLGAGMVTEAYKIATPQLDGSGMARAMRASLADAQLPAEAIGHISAHAPSTPQGDLAEARAIHACFEQHAKQLSVTAPKSMYGHAIGASSAIQTALLALSLQSGELLPTAHLDAQDPEIELDIVREARDLAIEHGLVNAFGFGGHNIGLVLGRVTQR